MAEQRLKKFTWVLKKFSSLQDERCYSRHFFAAGCNWRLVAYPKGHKNGGYLCVYLELADPESLPSGWRREVKYSLTVVNKARGKSNIVLGDQLCFDAKHQGWGYDKFVSLTKLHAKDQGFLVNNKLIIIAELHVLPDVVPEETVEIIEPLSSREGTQADDASTGNKSQGDSSSQVVKKTENAASQENLDDDGSSEEGSDDDDDTSYEGTNEDSSWEEVDGESSSHVSGDGGGDISLLNQSSALEEASITVGSQCMKSNSVAAETEISNGENDDAPNKDVDDEASSLVSNNSARNKSSLDQVKSLEDATQTVVNVTSVTETANNLLMEIQTVKETMHVNGFEIISSQVDSVSHIFERHPDIALDFRPKNQKIRRAYMNELLILIETLCQSSDTISEDDLSNADDTLVDLTDVGFKLDWLKTKVNEISEKKKKEQGSVARIQTMEEQLQKLKFMFLDLESQLHKEKAEALAARSPLSFYDVVR